MSAPGLHVRNIRNILCLSASHSNALYRKSFGTRQAFIQHLKSLLHSKANERLQCIHCLRFFDSVTALTQHAEAQGVRCNVREFGGQYGNYVDILTGSTATIDGEHEDQTVKYAIRDNVGPDMDAARRVFEANAAAIKSRKETKENHWLTHTPDW